MLNFFESAIWFLKLQRFHQDVHVVLNVRGKKRIGTHFFQNCLTIYLYYSIDHDVCLGNEQYVLQFVFGVVYNAPYFFTHKLSIVIRTTQENTK